MQDTHVLATEDDLRRSYRPPQLVVHGSMRELTANGSGANGENVNFPDRTRS